MTELPRRSAKNLLHSSVVVHDYPSVMQHGIDYAPTLSYFPEFVKLICHFLEIYHYQIILPFSFGFTALSLR